MARWAPVDYRQTFLVALLAAHSFSTWLSKPCFVSAFSSAPRSWSHSTICSRPHRHLLTRQPSDVQRYRPSNRNDAPCLSLLATLDDHDGQKSTKSAAKLAPLWTSVAATAGLLRPDDIGPTLGSLPAVSASLSVLMLAMGLTTSPKDVSDSFSQQRCVLLLNAICCF